MSNTRTDRAAAGASSLAIVAAFACIACTLFLIAATIVLALIPVFISEKDVTVNPNAVRSAETQAIMPIDGNPTAGARKRDLSNSSNYTGATLESSNYANIRSLFLSYLPASIVSDITINNVTFIDNPYIQSSRLPYALEIFFIVVYKSNCYSSCQRRYANSLNETLYKINANSTRLGTLVFTKNGKTLTITIARFIMAFVQRIIPSGSSEIADMASTVSTTISSSSNSTVGTANNSNGTG